MCGAQLCQGQLCWNQGKGKNTDIKVKTRKIPEIPPLGTKSCRGHWQLLGSCIPELPKGAAVVSRTFLLGSNIYSWELGEERELESGWVWRVYSYRPHAGSLCFHKMAVMKTLNLGDNYGKNTKGRSVHIV